MVVHRYYANSFVPSPEHSWGALDPPNTAYVHPEGFSFPFSLGILRHQSLHLCVTGDITTKKNEQLIGSRTQKSCFLYGLRLWGDWCEIYRLVKKKRQKSLCCILWLFYTYLKILYETISFYTVACIPFWVQVWGLVTETAVKKPGICPHLGTNPYSSSLPQHLLWPHWSHIKEWGYLFTYLIGHCKECESWQRLGLESTMPLAK